LIRLSIWSYTRIFDQPEPRGEKIWWAITFHGFECPIKGNVFAYRDEKIVEGCRCSAAITRNDAADVGEDVPNEPDVSDEVPIQKWTGAYSQTCSKTAVKYKAAGATRTAEGGTRWPASRIRMLSLDSAMISSSASLRVEYASHLSRRS